MKTHYHLISGFHGCLSESNTVYETKKEAREALKDTIRDLRDSGNTFSGNLKALYFEAIKKADFLGDYVDIEECQEEDCLKELDE